jgi:hypothetical protein
MSNRYGLLLALFASSLLASCASSRIPGEYAHVSVSPAFSPSGMHTIAMMPMMAQGKQTLETDRLTGDRLASRLIDLGFRVIDQTRLEAEASARKIDLTKPLTDKDLRDLASVLNAEAYVTGNVSWRYVPAHSESNTEVVQASHTEIKTIKDKDGKSRFDTTIVKDDVPRMRQSSTEGQYVLTGETIKILSLASGEVLVAGDAPAGPYDLTDEIVDAIRNRLFPPKQQ